MLGNKMLYFMGLSNHFCWMFSYKELYNNYRANGDIVVSRYLVQSVLLKLQAIIVFQKLFLKRNCSISIKLAENIVIITKYKKKLNNKNLKLKMNNRYNIIIIDKVIAVSNTIPYKPFLLKGDSSTITFTRGLFMCISYLSVK